MPKPFPRDVELLFASDYLRECDLQGAEVTVRIEGVSIEDLQMADGSKDPAPVLTLAKTKKRLVCGCKTNGRGIAVLLGRAPKDWIGKRITIRPEVDPISGMPCIRVCGSPDAAPTRLKAWQDAKRCKGRDTGPRGLPMRLLRTLARIDPPRRGPSKAELELQPEPEDETPETPETTPDDDIFGSDREAEQDVQSQPGPKMRESGDDVDP